MRKLLVSMVALCCASLASASMVDITVHDWEYVGPHIALDLGISGSTGAAETVYLLLTVDAADGTLTGGNVLLGGLSAMFPSYYTDTFVASAGLADQSALSAVLADLGALNGALVGGIQLTANAPWAVVSLYTSADTVTWTLADWFRVTLVPEPMTMGLLGLGSLFMARGRKQAIGTRKD